MKRFRQTESSQKFPEDVPSGINRLITTLTNSKIATQNNALYQTIFGLIKNLSKYQTDTGKTLTTIQATIDSGGGGSGGGGVPLLLSETFLTADDQSVTLPNSRELIAGTGIAFDDSVTNERTIYATGAVTAGYWTLLTDGDVDETDFIFANGDPISVFIPVDE